jgi:hypothetical protein
LSRCTASQATIHDALPIELAYCMDAALETLVFRAQPDEGCIL